MLFFRETIYQNYQYNYYLSRLDPISSPPEIRMRVALSSNVYSGLSFPLLYPSGNYVYFLERVNNYRDQFLHLKRAKTSNLEISTVQQVQEPKSLTDFRGTLYFVATTDETGEELFRVKDGGYYGIPTVALASDIRIGRSGSSPASLTPMGNELFFSADGGDHGRELWKIRSEGSSAELAIDMYSGLNSSEPTSLTASPNFLIMSAHNATYGREPWVASRWRLGEFPALTPTPTPPSSPGGAGNSRSPRPEAYPYNASGRVKRTVKLKYAVYYQGSTSEEISIYRPHSTTKLFFVKTYYGDARSSGVIYNYLLNTRRLKRGRYTWCVNSFTESGRSGTAKCAGLRLR